MAAKAGRWQSGGLLGRRDAPLDPTTTTSTTSNGESVAHFYRATVELHVAAASPAAMPPMTPSPPPTPSPAPTTKTTLDAPRTCALCGAQLAAGIRMRDHARSTTHQMAVGNAPASRRGPHALTDANVGFRMLQRAGWRGEEQGLGRDEGGRLEPVPTSLKLDRLGLGAGKAPRRVTHDADEILRAYEARRRIKPIVAAASMTPAQRARVAAQDRDRTRDIRAALR